MLKTTYPIVDMSNGLQMMMMRALADQIPQVMQWLCTKRLVVYCSVATALCGSNGVVCKHRVVDCNGAVRILDGLQDDDDKRTSLHQDLFQYGGFAGKLVLLVVVHNCGHAIVCGSNRVCRYDAHAKHIHLLFA